MMKTRWISAAACAAMALAACGGAAPAPTAVPPTAVPPTAVATTAATAAPKPTTAPPTAVAATAAPSPTAAPTAAPPTAAPAATSAGPASVTKVVLYRDNGKGDPGDEVKSFKQAERMIHLAYELSGLVAGKTISITFTGVETSKGKNLALGDLQGNVLLGNRITAKAPVTGKLPIGTYSADLYLNGQLVGKAPFTIEPDAGETPIVAGESKLFRDDGYGEAGRAVSSFQPSDKIMHFSLATKGASMKPHKITWIYTALDTTAGKGKITEAVDERILEDSTLTSFLELTDAAPMGKFQVEVLLDGKPLKTIPFEVKQ